MAQSQDDSNQRSSSAYLDFVNRFVETFESGRSLPTGTPHVGSKPQELHHRVVLCSPHPDDEALVGGLPLRLLREAGAAVLNCAITLGSNPAKRKRRLLELESSCNVLGFSMVVPNHPHGLDGIAPDSRTRHDRDWRNNVDSLAQIFDSQLPDLVFLPHADDYHPTHIGTHYLVLDAVRIHLQRTKRAELLLVETEFWHPMREPNLLLGLSPQVLARLLMATAEHRGEVERNPYHLTLPARLMDNVRRGSEVLGNFGRKANPFLFGELYRLSVMKAREEEITILPRQVIAPEEAVVLEGQRLFSKLPLKNQATRLAKCSLLWSKLTSESLTS